MGNPSWGAGYHKGFDEGKTLGTIIGVAGIVIGGVIAGAQWTIGKIRKHRIAKHEAETATAADDTTEVAPEPEP